MPQLLRYNSGQRYGTPGLRYGGTVPDIVMPQDNHISATLSAADKAAFIAKINEAIALLPFAVNLTPEERQSIPSIKTERAGMLDDFVQEMTAHPELVPSYIDMAEVLKDVGLLRDLFTLRANPAALCERIDDAIKLLGSDLLGAFFPFYGSVKEARRHNVPGIDTTYQRLAVYFARRPRTPSTPPPNP